MIRNSFEAAKAAGEAGKPDVWLAFRTPHGPRDVVPSSWRVHRPGTKTDPDGPWYNHGSKTFTGKKNSAALQKAMDWASEKYGISGWVKIPGFGGDYFPAESVDAIKAAKKAGAST